MKKHKVLILGITGMLGHSLFMDFLSKENIDVYGTLRNPKNIKDLIDENIFNNKIFKGIDLFNFNSFIKVFGIVKPEIVINCIGIIKQLSIAKEYIPIITINALFPHKIANLCKTTNSRMIHISTDCVFNGERGEYTEEDIPNAYDLYGKTKHIGEVSYPHCITLRTSIIGHELNSSFGLIEWFLSQEGFVKGFKKALYTGFPTFEIARIIREYIIPNKQLKGLYHVSSETISKYELLKLVAKNYSKKIEIIPDEEFYINRSLKSSLFRKITGYTPPTWPQLVEHMHLNYNKLYN